MTADIGEVLSRELGASRVLRPDSERLADYGRDENRTYYHLPDCAALCETREQVSAVLRVCAEQRVPVTPRGAGSGLTGGCVPVRGGVVLSTERMDRILELDPDDLVAVCEPGVITGRIQEEAEQLGLFYPPDPASLGFCSIGGNVANNAGGPRAFKYGVTREYVLGLEVGLMGGELLRAGRRTAKGVTGYDVVGGFVGSEGTFGVITEVTLALMPRPAAVATVLAIFGEMAAAGAAVDALLHRGFVPRAIELADRASIDHVRGRARFRFPPGAGAICLIELDGEPEGLEAAMIRVGQLCEEHGAVEVLVAQDAQERRALWEARRLISPSLREAHSSKISEDVCVPRGAIPELLRRIDVVAAEVDLPFATFGHAGDGNLHVNLLIDGDEHEPVMAARIERALTEVFRHTLELRGTLSGEHGIGLAKRRFMPMEQSPALLAWQRKWKQMWDPLELLNPGKVLPERPAGCHE